MKLNTVPVKWLFLGVSIGTTLIMCVITLVLFVLTHQTATLVTGGLLIFCSFIGLLLLDYSSKVSSANAILAFYPQNTRVQTIGQ